MPAYKVWCDQRQKKKCILADSTINSLLAKVKDKFLLTEAQSVQVVLEEDGTEVDDDECLEAFKDKVLMVLADNTVWVSSRHEISPISSSPESHSSTETSSDSHQSSHRKSSLASTTADSSTDWGETFEIPWSKVGTVLLTKLERSIGREKEPEMKLLKTEISEIIRNLVPEIRVISKYPGRDSLRSIAGNMIAKYRVLADLDDEGKIIGSGIGTIAIKMEEHNNYLNRPSKNASLLSLICSPTGADGRRNRKKDKKSAQSGTVEWQPEYPAFEDEKTQIEKKKWLINEARKRAKERDADKVLNFMESTYATQRLLLNSDNASVSDLQKEWPLLLESVYLFKHCERLVLGFRPDFNYWCSEKLKRIISFMEEAITVEKAKAIL